MVERTGLLATPKAVLAPATDKIFGINIYQLNIGYLPIIGEIHRHHFEYPKIDLTEEEENKQFMALSALVPHAQHTASVLLPHSEIWGTFEDERFRKDEWESVLSGKILVYLFIRFNYLVDNNQKSSEFCMYIREDYPALHACIGHNRIIDND